MIIEDSEEQPRPGGVSSLRETKIEGCSQSFIRGWGSGRPLCI